METALTPAEASELQAHEAVIEGGIDKFLEVGRALLAIRDRRLYRGTAPTFEAYCRSRWGFGRAHAYRLIEAARIQDAVSPTGRHLSSERQARALADVPDELKPAALILAAHTWAEFAPMVSGEPEPPSDWVRAAADVTIEVVNTGGYVDDGDGGMSAATAAVAEAATERVFRRWDAAYRKRTPLLKDTFTDVGAAAEALRNIPHSGAVKVIVYKEDKDGEPTR